MSAEITRSKSLSHLAEVNGLGDNRGFSTVCLITSVHVFCCGLICCDAILRAEWIPMIYLPQFFTCFGAIV